MKISAVVEEQLARKLLDDGGNINLVGAVIGSVLGILGTTHGLTEELSEQGEMRYSGDCFATPEWEGAQAITVSLDQFPEFDIFYCVHPKVLELADDTARLKAILLGEVSEPELAFAATRRQIWLKGLGGCKIVSNHYAELPVPGFGIFISVMKRDLNQLTREYINDWLEGRDQE